MASGNLRQNSFQGFYLMLIFIFLAFWRKKSRAALGSTFRKWLKEKAPIWLKDFILIFGQWWVLLLIALSVEIIITKASIWSVLDVTLDKRNDMGWLVYLSRWACPACILTYLLCVVAIGLQVNSAWFDAKTGKCGWYRGLKWVLQPPRDVVVQVLFMPMVYHFLMCRSMLRQWDAMQNGGAPEGQSLSAGELEHAYLARAISGADTGLAEMYDAYALWCFGNLGMSVADRELRKGAEQERSSVFIVLQSTLMFGVRAYVVTAVLGALYSTGLAFVSLNFQPVCHNPEVPASYTNVSKAWIESQKGSEFGSGWCTFTNVIYGADFATSTIAIYNLFFFEHQLSEPLKKFKPGLKFWSMKIPVTLSFSVLILLKLTQPITKLESEVLELLDTACKAYFMVLVALLNVVAWWPTEEWYCWEELLDQVDSPSVMTPETTDVDSETDDSEGGQDLEGPEAPESGQRDFDNSPPPTTSLSIRDANVLPAIPSYSHREVRLIPGNAHASWQKVTHQSPLNAAGAMRTSLSM